MTNRYISNESCNKNSIFAVWKFFDLFKSLHPLNSSPHHLQMFLQNLNLTMGVCECFYPGKFVPNKVFTLKVCDETQTCRNKVCIGQKVCKYHLMQKRLNLLLIMIDIYSYSEKKRYIAANYFVRSRQVSTLERLA